MDFLSDILRALFALVLILCWGYFLYLCIHPPRWMQAMWGQIVAFWMLIVEIIQSIVHLLPTVLSRGLNPFNPDSWRKVQDEP